jgi:hypothetical protein
MSYEEKYLKYKNKYLALKTEYDRRVAAKAEQSFKNLNITESSNVNLQEPLNVKLVDLIGGAKKNVEPKSETTTTELDDLFSQAGGKRKIKDSKSSRSQFFEDPDLSSSSESSTDSDSSFSSSSLDW